MDDGGSNFRQAPPGEAVDIQLFAGGSLPAAGEGFELFPPSARTPSEAVTAAADSHTSPAPGHRTKGGIPEVTVTVHQDDAFGAKKPSGSSSHEDVEAGVSDVGTFALLRDDDHRPSLRERDALKLAHGSRLPPLHPASPLPGPAIADGVYETCRSPFDSPPQGLGIVPAPAPNDSPRTPASAQTPHFFTSASPPSIGQLKRSESLPTSRTRSAGPRRSLIFSEREDIRSSTTITGNDSSLPETPVRPQRLIRAVSAASPLLGRPPSGRRQDHLDASHHDPGLAQIKEKVIRDGLYNVANMMTSPKRRWTAVKPTQSVLIRHPRHTVAGDTSVPVGMSSFHRRYTVNRPATLQKSLSTPYRDRKIRYARHTVAGTADGTEDTAGSSNCCPSPYSSNTIQRARSESMRSLLGSLSRHQWTGGSSFLGHQITPYQTPKKRTLEGVKNAGKYISLVVAEHPVQELRRYRGTARAHEAFATDRHAIEDDRGIFASCSISNMEAAYVGGFGAHGPFPGCSDPGVAYPAEALPPLHNFPSCDAPIAYCPRQRWLEATRSILTSRTMVRYAATMADKSAPPEDRLYAVIQLEHMLWGNPQKRRVVAVLRNLVKGQKPSFSELLHVEIVTTGERILDWFTPAQMDHHRLYFSCVYSVVTLTVFFYMAGEYKLYRLLHEYTGNVTSMDSDAIRMGPRTLFGWVSMRVPDPNDAVFCATYLRLWGGRYAPDLDAGHVSQWYTSVFIHDSFPHLLCNLLLTLGMSLNLECKYGAWRMLLLWSVSCAGGQILSASFEDLCKVVVGGSGGVFGFVGLFMADMLVNFQTIKRPLLRVLLIFIFMMYFAVSIAKGMKASHFSHIGGLLCGLFSSFLFLPKLRKGRLREMVLPGLGIAVLLTVFVVLPVYLYIFRFRNIACAELSSV